MVNCARETFCSELLCRTCVYATGCRQIKVDNRLQDRGLEKIPSEGLQGRASELDMPTPCRPIKIWRSLFIRKMEKFDLEIPTGAKKTSGKLSRIVSTAQGACPTRTPASRPMKSRAEVVAMVRAKIRLRHFALSTVQSYCGGTARNYDFCGGCRRRDAGLRPAL